MIVLDASVYVAAVRPSEPRHASALGLLAAHPPPWLVPVVFRVEVAAALARRGEAEATTRAVDVHLRGPAFQPVPIDDVVLDEAIRLARDARLRGYDAIYAATASVTGATLLTLDEELRTRLAGHVQVSGA